MTTQACMGGWCTKRGHCAHYHATDTTEPAERLCPPGQDGAGFIHLQPFEDEMRAYLSPEKQQRIVDMLTPAGMSVKAIAAAIGCALTNARAVVSVMSKQGRVFTIRTCSADISRSETFAFPTADARDAFGEQCKAASAERQRRWHEEAVQRKRAAREAEGRTRSATSIAAQRREAQRAVERSQQRALAAAEAELKKQKARLEREASAAQKATERKAARTAQKRLQVETRAAGKLVPFKTDAKPAPVRVTPQPRVELPIIIPANVRITRAPTPPDRWAVSNPASVVSSSECRAWAKAVTA